MSTYTISSLRKTLGLSTANQVRNRIEAIKDILHDHLRRGPNNQILVSEAGVDLLRRLQELYDSGLTMTEASTVLRATIDINDTTSVREMRGITSNREKQSQTDPRVDAMRAELVALKDRVALLEQAVLRREAVPETVAWWERLREDLDAT